jgi:hypothetical protein
MAKGLHAVRKAPTATVMGHDENLLASIGHHLEVVRMVLADRLGVSVQMVHLVLRGRRKVPDLRRRIEKELAKGDG